jgi:hypothetical protein
MQVSKGYQLPDRGKRGCGAFPDFVIPPGIRKTHKKSRSGEEAALYKKSW